MRAACYARFSSDLQRETSLEDQVRTCREYCESHGWQWQEHHVFADAAISGASIDGRAGLQKLLAAAASQPRPFDAVLVDDSSRIARDLADALRVLQLLKFAGVRVIYISQSIDSTSEQAETLIAVHGLVDGLFLREMAAKIRRGLAGQLERGFSTGAFKYGYRMIPVPDPSGRLDPSGHPALLGKRIEVNEAEAAVIRRIFQWYASGIGVGTIVNRLNLEGLRTRRGELWGAGGVRGLLRNERLTGKQIWGQLRVERRPGTRQKVFRPVPRAEWRVNERPDLRIIDDDLWTAVQARAEVVSHANRQKGRTLMRGRNAALHSKHLFAGLMRCGVCGGAITIVTGGYGSPRYGCQRRSKNGSAVCANGLTIRAKVADPALLAGLRAELLQPDTVAYIADQLTTALNVLLDQRPAQRDELERAISAADSKLRNLIAAVEAGAGAPTVLKAIKDRETELRGLQVQREALDEPWADRLAVIPSWVRRQLEDVAGLLADVPHRAKTEFHRLELRFTLHPIDNEGPRPFLRAEGFGNFERLAFSRYTTLYSADRSTRAPAPLPFASVFASFSEGSARRSTTGATDPRSGW